ncbi:30S ribosomal protein S20 [Verrucomicrobiota bacterium sgz303538]
MANTKSAAKRARQTERRTLANRRVLTAVKTQTKRVRETIKAGNKDAAQSVSKSFVSTLDKAAKTGRIHRNKANRLKSRANKALVALA